MKIPAGFIIKQIIDEKGLKGQEVADRMGMSRQAVYQSYAKMVLSDAEMLKWSEALGVSKDNFVNRLHSGEAEPAPKGSSDYLIEHLTNLEEQFKRLLNQIDVKDRQIEGLQKTVEVLLGKSDPADEKSNVKKMWDRLLVA